MYVCLDSGENGLNRPLNPSSNVGHHPLTRPHVHRLSPTVFMRCQLNRLQKGQMIDEWFPLSSHVPLKGIEPGSLRVRARYSMEKIMPEEEYSEFKEVSSSFSFKSVAH